MQNTIDYIGVFETPFHATESIPTYNSLQPHIEIQGEDENYVFIIRSVLGEVELTEKDAEGRKTGMAEGDVNCGVL